MMTKYMVASRIPRVHQTRPTRRVWEPAKARGMVMSRTGANRGQQYREETDDGADHHVGEVRGGAEKRGE